MPLKKRDKYIMFTVTSEEYFKLMELKVKLGFTSWREFFLYLAGLYERSW